MKIFALTWNIHGYSSLPEIPSDSDLSLLSLQECHSLSNLKRITGEFPFVKIISMFGLKTVILSKRNIKIEYFRIGQGFFGFVNKGFIATKIYWEDHIILHINAHLSAHSWNRKKRVEQMEEILSFTNEQTVNTVIISGDLNFRNESNFRNELNIRNESNFSNESNFKNEPNIRNESNTKSESNSKNVNILSKGDSNEGISFKNKYKIIKEAPLKFNPSYKFDGAVYDKTRIPSYCDRVMVGSTREVNFIDYQSMDEIVESDHKPVFCRFQIIGDSLEKLRFEEATEKKNFLLKKIWTRMVLFFLERKVRLIVILGVFLGIMMNIITNNIEDKSLFNK